MLVVSASLSFECGSVVTTIQVANNSVSDDVYLPPPRPRNRASARERLQDRADGSCDVDGRQERARFPYRR